jgi:DNA-binding transcriptional MerR regulator
LALHKNTKYMFINSKLCENPGFHTEHKLIYLRVRLKLILRGKRLGFSLAETRELFDLWDETLSGSEKQLNLMLKTITTKRAELEQQLKDIAMVQLELDSAESRCLEALTELQQKKMNAE